MSICPVKDSGSIPAWAGETVQDIMDIGVEAVYPRVGGGNTITTTRTETDTGLSPRGRGKRIAGYRPCQRQRSIPAWAGETGCIRSTIVSIKVYPRVGGGNIDAGAFCVYD